MTLYEGIYLIITGISLAGSIFLWYITYQTLREVKAQNKNISNSMMSETVDKINSAHREIFLSIVNQDDLITIFNNFHHTTDIKTKENLLGTLFFNHIQTIYTYYNKGLLAEDDWVGYQNDTQCMFNHLNFLKKW